MPPAPPIDPAPARGAAPRRFHGWAMLGVTTVVLVATAPGQTVLVSQFNESIRADLGLSASALSTAYMVGTVTASVPLVLVGRLADRRGPRLMTAVVATLFCGACALIGLVQGVVGLTLCFFLLRFLGQGSLGLLSGHALAMWFERRLGTVNGIKMTAAQLGFAVLPAVCVWLIAEFGWRRAYALLGVGSLVAVLPLVLLVSRDQPSQLGQRIDGRPPATPRPGPDTDPATESHDHDDDPACTLREALSTPQWWTLALAMSLNGLVGTALLFHVQPLLEGRGVDVTESAAVVRTWSLAMMAGTIPFGWVADRVAPRILLPVSVLLVGASAALQLAPGGAGVVHASMLVFGVAQACAMSVGTPTIARYFGRRHHGAVRSTVTLLGVAGTGMGPVVLGLSLDRTGSATSGLVLFAAACAPLALAAAYLRPPRR